MMITKQYLQFSGEAKTRFSVLQCPECLITARNSSLSYNKYQKLELFSEVLLLLPAP